MATKESLQIRELAARSSIREALNSMADVIGVDLPTPISDPSPDPTYRNIVEWERVARDILGLQAGLKTSPASIAGDDTPKAAADTNTTYADAEAAAPDVEPGAQAADAAPEIEPTAEVEPKTKGKKK